MKLTDQQWEIIEPLLSGGKSGPGLKGRPRRKSRDVLEGILWILRTGARWKDLPKEFPPYQTCHRRFGEWIRDGTLNSVLHAIVADLQARGGIDLSETYIDGSFSSAKKGGAGVGKTERGKGTKIMAIAERHGLPVALWVGSASPHEATLVEATVDNCFVAKQPQRLIGDKAYDSDPLDARLKSRRAIELIAPRRRNRRKDNITQDGRPFRRYCRRWKVEPLFAWLHNFRRIVTRWEYKVEFYLGFVQLGCVLILLRHF